MVSGLAKYIQYYGSLTNRACDNPPECFEIEQFSVKCLSRTVVSVKSEL